MPYLTDKEMKVVKAYCDDVREALGDNVIEIKLFGSRARGEGDEESDIDILFILQNLNADIDDRIVRITVDYMVEFDVVISPIIYIDERWKQIKKFGSFFVKNVEREAIAV